MMHMTLYWGTEVTLLFDTWRTDSDTSYALSLFACFLVASFYQYMEDRRVRLGSTPGASSSVNVPLLGGRKIGAGWWRRVGSAAMFGVNAGIGYLLMLAVMSFNGGVLLSVMAGLSVGFFLFRDGFKEEDDDDRVPAVSDSACGCA